MPRRSSPRTRKSRTSTSNAAVGTVDQAVQAIRQGGLVACPTEAVWGLSCDPGNEQAVARLLALKQRPRDKGLILIADSLDQLRPWLAPLDPELEQLVTPSWPGPATWLLPAAPETPRWLRGNHDTLAVRVTAHPLCRRLCQLFGGPIVSSSANLAGAAPARTEQEVLGYFSGQLDAIVSGETGGLSQPTPIRDARTGKIVRP